MEVTAFEQWDSALRYPGLDFPREAEGLWPQSQFETPPVLPWLSTQGRALYKMQHPKALWVDGCSPLWVGLLHPGALLTQALRP